MKNYILNFPYQFKKGIEAAKNIKISGKFDNIIVCGMGGSAWPAELLRDWLDFVTIDGYIVTRNFKVNKTYELPLQINEKSLIIPISYSGNTEETISCFKEAKQKGLSIIGITTNGELQKLCQQEKIPVVLLPNDVPIPRLGCGYTFSALYKVLNNAKIIENKDKEILEMAENLNPKDLQNQGKKLAKKLKEKIPIIYSSSQLKTISYIWKIKLNETSKSPAFCNYFPELNHNELSSYSMGSHRFAGTAPAILILRDPKDNPKIKKRMDLTAEIIRQKGYYTEIIEMSGRNLLERIFKSIILADWTSYYLAMEYKVNPLSTKLQEEFKKKMAKFNI